MNVTRSPLQLVNPDSVVSISLRVIFVVASVWLVPGGPEWWFLHIFSFCSCHVPESEGEKRGFGRGSRESRDTIVWRGRQKCFLLSMLSGSTQWFFW
jgi:hypothetical protein